MFEKFSFLETEEIRDDIIGKYFAFIIVG